MEGLRGYAVLLVFLVHHHTLFGWLLPSRSLAYDLSAFGQDIGFSGVDLFFVLSGYLIYGHLLHRNPPYFSYIRKRARRLYPTFLFVFCIYLIFSFLMPSLSKLPHGAVNQITYVIANLLFLPGIFPIKAVITVSWSLSYECFFYLSIPLVITFTAMRRWQRKLRVLFFLGVLLLLCFGSYLDLFPHIRLGMFVAGIILYEFMDARWLTTNLSSLGELLTIALYGLTLLALSLFEFNGRRILYNPHFANSGFFPWTLLLCVVLFFLCIFVFAFDGVLRRVFSFAPLRWLGNMSYTYFLCHGIILYGIAFLLAKLIPGTLPSTPIFLALLVFNLSLTLLGSLVMFILIEKPFSLAPKRASEHSAAGKPVDPVLQEPESGVPFPIAEGNSAT
jgi:exopolysaccharide production protein ExoZ